MPEPARVAEAVRPPDPPRATLISRSPAIAAAMALAMPSPDEPEEPLPAPVPRAIPRSAPPLVSEPVAAAPALDVPAGPAPSEPPQQKSRGLVRPALQEWERVVQYVREREPATAAFLEHAVPQRVTAEKVVLGFQDGSFYGRRVASPETRTSIADAVQALLGGRPEIEIRFDAAASDSTRTVATIEAKRRDAELERRRREALNHPVVLDALEVFPEARSKVDVKIEKDEVNG
ncbi:MAG: hypothetical protein H5U40_00750 [Polyangiaceae bacterium]|nr:hypothetical protein [Polyangiaceae bacterium]